MKNRILTNSTRTIKKSFPRFLSLIIMSLLGVMVFVGLLATSPDMLNTIDNYYDEKNVYDIKILSSMGLIEDDIKRGESYVIVDGENIHGVFMFMQRVEPTYATLEGGEWLDDEPYGTIHRIATDGTHKRMFDLCVEFCEKITSNLRVDTHDDNFPMQKAIERNGFTYCGRIYMLHDGTPRIAYHRHR